MCQEMTVFMEKQCVLVHYEIMTVAYMMMSEMADLGETFVILIWTENNLFVYEYVINM